MTQNVSTQLLPQWIYWRLVLKLPTFKLYFRIVWCLLFSSKYLKRLASWRIMYIRRLITDMHTYVFNSISIVKKHTLFILFISSRLLKTNFHNIWALYYEKMCWNFFCTSVTSYIYIVLRISHWNMMLKDIYILFYLYSYSICFLDIHWCYQENRFHLVEIWVMINVEIIATIKFEKHHLMNIICKYDCGILEVNIAS